MVENSLWRKVSEEEKERIKDEARDLLRNFAEKLKDVRATQGHFKSGDGTREEGDGWKTDSEFRELTFENAPFIEEDSIVAEKRSWKK